MMSKIKKYKSTILYTIDKGHPNYQLYKNQEMIHQFSDTYEINKNCFFSDDEIIHYIKHDLSLIAGGGYNMNHIHNVTYIINCKIYN